jgi:hypothetical protein
MTNLYVRETSAEAWEVRDEPDGKLMATARDEDLANAIQCLLEKSHIIIDITGGCATVVMADRRLKPYLDSFVADFDTEGCCVEDDDDRVFNFLDYDGCRTLVSVGHYELDELTGQSDCELAVAARLDPSLRVKNPTFRRSVKGVVLFSDGTYEEHEVLVDGDDDDTERCRKEGKNKIQEQAVELNQVSGRYFVRVTDIGCGPSEEVEDEPEETST